MPFLGALSFAFQLIFYLFLNNTASKFIAVPGLHFAPFLIAEARTVVEGKSLARSRLERAGKKFRDLSRSSQVDIANEIYGVMISFKPRKVSLQFLFILGAFSPFLETYLLQFIDVWIGSLFLSLWNRKPSRRKGRMEQKSAKLNL